MLTNKDQVSCLSTHTYELSIEEELGIFPSSRAYLERKARKFFKFESIYDDSLYVGGAGNFSKSHGI